MKKLLILMGFILALVQGQNKNKEIADITSTNYEPPAYTDIPERVVDYFSYDGQD